MTDPSPFSPEQKLLHDLRHYPVRPQVGVGGIIKWKDYVVLVKRKFNPNKGLWAIPGGHLKLGERAADGALRECHEETGLRLEVEKLASVIDKIDLDKDGKVEYHYVLCDYWMKLKGYGEKYTGENDNNNPPPIFPQSDAEDARWVPINELINYKLTKTVRQLFENLNILPKSQ